MKIVGFGDSFIQDTHPSATREWEWNYQGQLANYYGEVPEFRGRPGTGPWTAFFDFLDYPDKDSIDVALFAWSEPVRLYHPTVEPLNTATVMSKKAVEPSYYAKNREVFIAARKYYECFMDERKVNYEIKGCMTVFDEMSKQYPKIKFIHMPCFTWHDRNSWWGDKYQTAKPEDLHYFHDFKNGVEIRPALMYLSMKDEWVGNLFNERRPCHLGKKMHKKVGDAIISGIEGYRPGRRIDIDF